MEELPAEAAAAAVIFDVGTRVSPEAARWGRVGIWRFAPFELEVFCAKIAAGVPAVTRAITTKRLKFRIWQFGSISPVEERVNSDN